MAQVFSNTLEASTFDPRFSQIFDIPLPDNQMKLSYHVVLEKGQDDWIVAKSPDVEGAISQGKNKDEALRNIVEAISLLVEDRFGNKAKEFSISWEEK